MNGGESIGYIGRVAPGVDGQVIMIGTDRYQVEKLVYTNLNDMYATNLPHGGNNLSAVATASIGNWAYVLTKNDSNTEGHLWRTDGSVIKSIIDFGPGEIPKYISAYRDAAGNDRLAIIVDVYSKEKRTFDGVDYEVDLINPRLVVADANGQILLKKRYLINWRKQAQYFQYGHAVAYWPQEDAFLLLGEVQLGPPFILKIDAETGLLEWERVYGALDWDDDDEPLVAYGEGRFNDIAFAGDGIILVGKAVKTDRFGPDGLILKLSYAGGDVIWQRLCGGTREDEFNSVAIAEDGTIVVGGYSLSKTFHPEGSPTPWVVDLAPDGYLLWEIAPPAGSEVQEVIPRGDRIYSLTTPWTVTVVTTQMLPGLGMDWSGPYQYPFAPSQFSSPGIGAELATTCYDPSVQNGLGELLGQGPPIRDRRIP